RRRWPGRPFGGGQGLQPLLRSRPHAERGGDPAARPRLGAVPESRRALSVGGDALAQAPGGGRRIVKKLSIPILGQGDPNRPRDVHLVGRYALGVDWTDGHGSIY